MMKLIDCWLNAHHPEFAPPFDPELLEIGTKRSPNLLKNSAEYTGLDAVVDLMDSGGVAKAVITDPYGSELLQSAVDTAIETHPDRFVGCVAVQPSSALQDMRKIRSYRERGYRAIKVLGVFSGLPYDHPKYFPIYAACEEESLVLSCTVGMPHIPISDQLQDPMALDVVMEHFPSLNVAMCHGGLPWAASCVALMRKWPRLYWMSSVIAEQRLPREIIDFGNDDGADRLMWATDFPALSFDEKRPEGANNHFTGDAAENYAWKTAERIFFG